MSYYRDSPSRSPIRSEYDRDRAIQDQISINRSVKMESENRRLLDQISLLKIKIRKGEELEDKCDALLRQVSALGAQNDALARQLSQRRYQLERNRANHAQNNERQALRANQLLESNRSLELQIDLLKKERLESNKLFQSHIQKLQIMLQEKVRQLDALSLRFNDLLNEKEVLQIKFEEEINKLKNLLTRTSHEMERDFQNDREKQLLQKSFEIETLKKHYTSQILLLEDEIKKLTLANQMKTNEFQSQLVENRNIRNRYEDEIRIMGNENDNLRQRILKLQEHNRSQVETIQQKYSDIHTQGTTSLKQQHSRQIRLLLDEIEKLKWILNEKNNQIQTLVKEKRDQRKQNQDKQLQLTSDIQTLRNKLNQQIDLASKERNSLMEKINDLTDKLFRQSQSYHERVKNFNQRINDLESQVKYKQNDLDRAEANNEAMHRQNERAYDQLDKQCQRIKRQLQDEQESHSNDNRRAQQYKSQSLKDIQKLRKQIRALQVKNDELNNKIEQLSDQGANKEDLLKAEVKSLRQTVLVLEQKLSQEQNSHSKQMKQLSDNMRKRIGQLEATQKKTLQQITLSKNEQIQLLKKRFDQSSREKAAMEEELKKYIKMYNDLSKYFPSPHEGSLFQLKGQNNIYEVLNSTSKSSIHIF